MPDRKLAERLKCGAGTVRHQRILLGIPAHLRMPPNRGLLAVSPGKVVARRLALGLTRKAVTERAGISNLLYIERGYSRAMRPAAADRLAAALECRVEDILLRSGPVARTVPDDSLLGTMTDRALARRWRLSCNVVGCRRRGLGIPKYWSYPPLPDESLLGTRTDRDLAALWGVTLYRIRNRRETLGIPSFTTSARIAVSAVEIRARRVRLGATQLESAKRSGLSYGYYNDIERGQYKAIPRNTAECIASALNCAVEDFAVPRSPPPPDREDASIAGCGLPRERRQDGLVAGTSAGM